MLMTLCNGCTIEFGYEGFFTPFEPPKNDPFKGLADYGQMVSDGVVIRGFFAPADEWCPPVTEVPPIDPAPPVGQIPLPGTLILLVLGLVLMRRVWVWVN